MIRYKAVLFDLDGTLIDTAPEIADAVNDTLSATNPPASASSAATTFAQGAGARSVSEGVDRAPSLVVAPLASSSSDA